MDCRRRPDLSLSSQSMARPSRVGQRPRPAAEEYSDTEFLSRFRFAKSTVASLLTSLPLKSSTDNGGQPVPPTMELLIALRFYGAACMRNEPCPPIISFPATQQPQQPQRHLPLLAPVDTLSGSRARARLTARFFS
ncbi:hypothetical protein HPB52_003327 [Rhipicephalus sanguineus]|uniref:Uncharacterized protein n=1 Tax=Rhipicephalus sanguineus TaxID=34632 RepID=A0A9D4PEQ0_RHISA|nr:hypothetical protein HPB52_003327 [Rhipicephalus sanguineus]